MSARWRAQQKTLYESQYESGNEPAMNAELDLMYAGEYPIHTETRFVDAQNRTIANAMPVGSVRDNIEWDIGGEMGATKGVFGMGVVESTNVDAHDFNGQQAVIRRMPDTNYGPVATEDYSGSLALLFAMQESAHYFPNELSTGDLVKAV